VFMELSGKVKKIQEEIEILSNNLDFLDKEGSEARRRPFIAGLIALLPLLLLVSGLVSLNIRRAHTKSQQEEARIQEQEAEQARATSEAEEAQQSVRQEQIAEQEKEGRETAEAQKQAEEERKKHEAEQSRRKDYAREQFSKINLVPNIHLGPHVKAANPKIYLTGGEYERILRLHAAEEWLELINLTLRKSYPEYPDVRSIENAASRLNFHSQEPFYLVCEVRLPEEPNRKLTLLNLRKETNDYNALIDRLGSKKIRPDGSGYVWTWKPWHGDILLVFGKSPT
jgi:flagellar motility protein MotE (MotC chaperone)